MALLQVLEEREGPWVRVVWCDGRVRDVPRQRRVDESRCLECGEDDAWEFAVVDDNGAAVLCRDCARSMRGRPGFVYEGAQRVWWRLRP